MKKTFKGILIACGVFACIGVILLITGFLLGGSWRQAWASITSGRYSFHWGADWEGDSVETGSYDLTNIKKLVVDIGAGNIKIKNGSSNQLTVQNNEDKGRLTVDVSGDKMIIKTRGKRWSHRGEVVITMPSDIVFDQVELNMSAGELEITNELKALELKTEATAGDLECKKVTAESSEFEITAGKVSVDNLDCKDTKLKTTAGKLSVTMSGSAKDYWLESENMAGDMTYDGAQLDWLGDDSIHGTQDAERSIEADCTAGDLNINFTN